MTAHRRKAPLATLEQIAEQERLAMACLETALRELHSAVLDDRGLRGWTSALTDARLTLRRCRAARAARTSKPRRAQRRSVRGWS